MFEFLKQWFGLKNKNNSDDEQLAIRYDRLADLPAGEALRAKTVLVCLEKQLVLTTEESLPTRLERGETCWVIPAGEVVLPIEVVMNGVTIGADVALRFESDEMLVQYLDNRDFVAKNELMMLLAGQWLELMTIQKIKAPDLIDGDFPVILRFRTHLSLLMQEYGFRCVGIAQIREINEPENQSQPLQLDDEIAKELKDAFVQVHDETEWNLLLDQLDDAGFEPDEQSAKEIDVLGEEYLARKFSADEAARKICAMMEQKNKEITAIRQETATWNALGVKLRLLGTRNDDEKNRSLGTAESFPKNQRLPSTWFMFRKYKIDEKLRKYLQDSSGELEKLVESVQKRQSSLTARSKLAKSQAAISRLQQHLETMPTLAPRLKNFRKNQRDPEELTVAVRSGVTAMQLTTGLLRKLATENYSNEEYEQAVREIENTLDLLENEIMKRKNIYNI